LTVPAVDAGYASYDFPQQLASLLLTALGALEAGMPSEPAPKLEILRVFISHGGQTRARDQLEKFIRFLGAEPVIVEDQPNLGATVNQKVRREAQSSHFAVVLGTVERAAQQDDKSLPRLNVVDELARLQEMLGGEHVLVALEKGVDVPSNTAEFVRARFTQECIEDVQAQLVNELRGNGLLSVRANPH
jgi:predicted nucleotide-binding protein